MQEQNEDAILQKQETIRDLKERLKALEMGADELATENRQLRDEKNILKIQLQELSDTLAIHEQQQMAGAHDDSEISADVVEEESLIQHDETINVNDCVGFILRYTHDYSCRIQQLLIRTLFGRTHVFLDHSMTKTWTIWTGQMTKRIILYSS